MGEIIRRDASADDIIADAEETIRQAAAKGGVWNDLAGERLVPSVALLRRINSDLEMTALAVVKLEAQLDVFDGHADDFLAAKADEMWDLVGRPGFDPAYSLIWPGGASTYTDGSNEEQPDRMELLADLLDAGIHPKLDPAWGKAAAQEVRERVAAYRQRLEPVARGRTRVKLLSKAKVVLARAVQMELARLKRRYLSEGFTEPDVHQVIPDRPRAKASGAEGSAGATEESK